MKKKKVIIILIIVVAFLGMAFLFLDQNTEDQGFSYNGVSLSEEDYLAITKAFANYSIIQVCNIETQKCIALGKLK